MNPEVVRPNVVGLGEVLWDVYPDAAHFGGAPANFACHAAALGAEAWMVSAVGRDRLGDDAVASLSGKGVHTLLVQRDVRPTGTVTVKLDADGKADYVFAADPAWDHIVWSESLALLAKKCTAICFGSLAQRAPESRATIRRFLQACSADCLRVFDVNLRQDFFSKEVIEASLGLTDVLKLNDEEVKVLADMLGLPADEEAFVAQIAARHGLSTVALTRGARGSLIWHQGRFDVNLRQDFFSKEVIEASLGLADVLKLNDEEVKVVAGMLGLPADDEAFVAQVAARHGLSTVALTRGARGSLIWHQGRFDEREAPKIAVVDTVGAGDAFTAALVTGLLREEDLGLVHRRASDIAAYVCTQPGATPELPPELRR